jgi:hypothetical protein
MLEIKRLMAMGKKQCSGSVIFWYGSECGSTDPYLRLKNRYGCGSEPNSSLTFRMQKNQSILLYLNVLINEI